MRLEHVTEVTLDGDGWGRDTSLVLGLGTDGVQPTDDSTRWWTGDPTAKRVYPDVQRGAETLLPIIYGSTTWTNMPATQDGFAASSVRYMVADLRRVNYARLVGQVTTGGAAGRCC